MTKSGTLISLRKLSWVDENMSESSSFRLKLFDRLAAFFRVDPNQNTRFLLQSIDMSVVYCRGVRGATTVPEDSKEEVLKATRQLLALMIRMNEIDSADVASATFTVTSDLKSEFPALAARQLGWLDVPLLCGYEISVPGSLPRCIRIMLLWNTTKTQSEIEHIYVREAVKLRPDLSTLPPVDWDELESWIQGQLQVVKK